MNIRTTVVAVTLIVAASASAQAQSVSAPVLDRTKQFMAAVKAKDATKIAACYAEDAVWMQPNGPRLKGQKAHVPTVSHRVVEEASQERIVLMVVEPLACEPR